MARIRFRTVSNDTGQDTAMVSKILIPTPLSLSFYFLFFPSFFLSLVRSYGMGRYERFTEVIDRVGMKRVP